MPDLKQTDEPEETAGGNVSNLRPTTGDMRVIMQTIGALGAKLDRLITDRKDDKDEVTRKIDDARADLTAKISDAKADLRERIDGGRQDHKDFIKDDFRPLRNDVASLRLKWAWMTGVGAVVGVLVGLGIEILKSHIN